MKIKTFFLFLTLILSSNVWAIDLDEAKQSGLVGERTNGFLGAVKHSGEVDALVAEINAKRTEAYARIAKKNGIAVDKVAELAAKKLINKAGPDDYVQTTSGVWVLKREVK